MSEIGSFESHKPNFFKEILEKYKFRDRDGDLLVEAYFSFNSVVLNEEHFTDEHGHSLFNCAEYLELRELQRPFLEAGDWIHNWFDLTYAQYLTIPRSVLQSMPWEWQLKFVKCLTELDRTIDWLPKKGQYRVILSDVVEEFDEDEQCDVSRWGRELDDPLMDYQRGRRQIPHVKKPANTLEEQFDFQEKNGE